jgi:purine nucleosidase
MAGCVKWWPLLLAATLAAAEPKKRIPVIIVADVGIDDAAATLLAVRHDELEILGIAASFGCHGDVRQTARNARRLLRAAGACVPVYVGSAFPLGESEPPKDDGAYIHGFDGFGDVEDEVESPDSSCSLADEPAALSAAEFIARTARERPGVDVLVFSPLTNLALATLIEPNLPSLVGRVVVMGGAVYYPGNVSPLAEANFAHDSRAAKVVVDAFSTVDGDKLVLAPLDVTMAAMVAQSTMAEVGEVGGAEQLLAKAWATYARNYCRVLKFCGDHGALHDVHPVAYLLWPEMYTSIQKLTIDVVVADKLGPSNGHSLVDRRNLAKGGAADDRTGVSLGVKKKATVLLDVDAPTFIAHFVESLVPDRQLVAP